MSSRKNTTILISFTIVLPAEASAEEIREWIEYELHQSGQIRLSNPLCNYDLESFGHITIVEAA